VRVGSKVVCVDDRFPAEALKLFKALPIQDRIYQIRSMEVGVNWRGEAGEVAVLLEGLINPCSTTPPHRERGFNQERFQEIEPPAEIEAEELAEAFA
jgi:hypothetical protein